VERNRTITSSERPLSRSELRELTALTVKKFRSERSRTIAEGQQVVVEALASNWTVHEVVVTPEFLVSAGIDSILAAMRKRGVELRTVTTDVMKKLSELRTSPGIFATVTPPSESSAEKPFHKGIALALDRISDPTNLGSIARTACFYGIDRLILSEDCADKLHPRALRASMGGLFHLSIETPKSLLERLVALKKTKVQIVIADAIEGGNALPDYKRKPVVLVLGSEAHGIREEVQAVADFHWRLQPIGRDLTLNVAAAAAVLLDRMTQEHSILAPTKELR